MHLRCYHIELGSYAHCLKSEIYNGKEQGHAHLTDTLAGEYPVPSSTLISTRVHANWQHLYHSFQAYKGTISKAREYEDDMAPTRNLSIALQGQDTFGVSWTMRRYRQELGNSLNRTRFWSSSRRYTKLKRQYAPTSRPICHHFQASTVGQGQSFVLAARRLDSIKEGFISINGRYSVVSDEDRASAETRLQDVECRNHHRRPD